MPTKDEVVEALKKVIDPELYLDVWTLGLIYDVDIQEPELNIKMTFTSVACPAGPQLVGEVQRRTEEVEGVDKTNVEVVFEPPWQPSEELKAMLGISY